VSRGVASAILADPQLRGRLRIHRLVAVLFLLFGVVAITLVARHGAVPGLGPIALLLLSAALFADRGGRFVRDWLPIVLGLLAYRLSGQLAHRLDLTVHYTPQIDADRVLGFGTLPTVWLQEHLYAGATGALEVFSVLMYLSHYFAPFLLAFFLWWRRSKGFSDLMLCLLTVTALAELTFLLAPTAPPWLAAEHGLIGPVHPILERSFSDLHLNGLAAVKGSASAYNIVAAVPSLHVAWPVVGLIVMRRHGFPKYAQAAQAVLVLGVVFAVVYMGEHYVVDALAGALYALVACWLVRRAVRGRETAERGLAPSF
jgi:PAP2 superfamily